ncbi:MAG: molybdopterin-dependent oxidoreductase [Oligoflexia bacterium]|nr:molybdopterin-dependent oxidoreductase [Oligoflexia bacterium]
MTIGKNKRHDSSPTHVNGKSIFVDDRPTLQNEIYVQVVGAQCAKGKLQSIDASEALETKGVLGVLTANDFKNNIWGTIVKEQPLLCSDQILYYDEPICLVVAENESIARSAAKLIKVSIKEEEPTFDIQKAIDQKNFCYVATPFLVGDPDSQIAKATHTLKGSFYCGGQEHFYMESQACIAYPMERGQIEVHASSQHPSETQHLVASALGLNYHQVTCVVKRMGGGFGGKESQAAPVAAYAALAAQKFGRPCRIAWDKDEDMAITGKRHPFLNFYEVAFNDEGKILGAKFDLYADVGAYTDLSPSILERAMFHIDGAYYFPDIEVKGTCVKTNTHSNTAFRGFGGPQGTMTIESIIEDIAYTLKKDAFEIRKVNIYQGEDQKTPYEQKVENNQLPKLFNLIETETKYNERRNAINQFNAKRNGKVRGLSVSAVKFGIAFTAKFLNQGNALVNLHLDGTAQVSTGATEMGQGVNSKIAQIVSHALGIDYDDVIVMPTSTEKNHNTSPTAASSGSDINGAAALAACNKIKKRLSILAKKHFLGETFDDVKEIDADTEVEGYKEIIFKDGIVSDLKLKKEIKLKELIGMAYMNRVSLGDYAHFKTDGLGFDKKTGKGKAFNYFTNGVALTEVEIDEYTGELKILTSKIHMDLGRPLNPGIDKGQVTGAFIQGAGWVTTENLFYSPQGKLLSHSPTTYKIPSIQDMPRDFEVNLIENLDLTVNVYGSKAVGEPPFLLGQSVWMAAKNALAYRANKMPQITSPATNEVILMELERVKG